MYTGIAASVGHAKILMIYTGIPAYVGLLCGPVIPVNSSSPVYQIFSTNKFPLKIFHRIFSTTFKPKCFHQKWSTKKSPKNVKVRYLHSLLGLVCFCFTTTIVWCSDKVWYIFYSIVRVVAASPPPAHKIDATSTIFHSNALWTTRPQLVMMWICKFAPRPSRHRAAHQQKRKKMIHSRHCYNCSNLSVVIQIKAWPLTFVLICTVAGQLKHWSSLYLWLDYCIFLCVLYLYLCTYVMMTMAHAKIICSQKIYGF